MKFLTAFNTPEEARVFKLYLESYDLEVEIRDDATIGAYPLASYALGGVKVFVAQEQFSQAEVLLIKYESGQGRSQTEEIPTLEGDLHDENIEILEEAEQKVSRNRILQTCPKCGSRQLSRPKIMIFPLLFALGILLGVLVRRWGWIFAGAIWWSSWTYLPSYKCKKCGKSG